ncbi:MAG: hypothetical protein ACYSTT_22560, partial [Planctomycetota bacterium]
MMVEYAKENRIALMTLNVCLCFILLISSSCKKKEQSEEIGQDVPAERIPNTSTSGQIVWEEASEKIDLQILYAGLLETDRAKDFVAFLTAHFEKVKTTDYLTFREAESAGFDVTIIDQDGVDTDPLKA